MRFTDSYGDLVRRLKAQRFQDSLAPDELSAEQELSLTLRFHREVRALQLTQFFYEHAKIFRDYRYALVLERQRERLTFSPRLEKIRDLRNVVGFTVKGSAGCIEFLEPVDLKQDWQHLDRIFEIRQDEIHFRAELCKNPDGLNRCARLTFYRFCETYYQLAQQQFKSSKLAQITQKFCERNNLKQIENFRPPEKPHLVVHSKRFVRNISDFEF